MRKTFLYYTCSLALFSTSIYSFYLYIKSLELLSLEMPVFEQAISEENIKLDHLELNTSYVFVIKAGIESDKLTASRISIFRQAVPVVKGLLSMEETIGGNKILSEFKVSSDIFSRISKHVRVNTNGTFEFVRSLGTVSKVSSEDYLNLKYNLEKGSLLNPKVSFYEDSGILSFLCFYPELIALIGLCSFVMGMIFLFVPVFKRLGDVFRI